MAPETSQLKSIIESGNQIVIAEVRPPKGCSASMLTEVAQCLKGKVTAVGVSDNRDEVTMCALASAAILAREGVEPILHMVMRDRNRIALISDILGAQALGVQNILCTSGRHQTLGKFKAAKNVYDMDSTQLIKALTDGDASIIGERSLDVAGLCLGSVASPCADPMPMQVIRLVKKAAAGTKFVVTDPVFSIDRFESWWNEVRKCEAQSKTAIIAGVKIFSDSESAQAYADKHPSPMVPESTVAGISSKADGITVACETISKLKTFDGIRGFELSGDAEAILGVIEKAGLGA